MAFMKQRTPIAFAFAFACTFLALAQTSPTPETSQSSVRRATFEVASIRLNNSGDHSNEDNFQPMPGGRFTATNCSLRLLIQWAFDLMPYQLSGGPDWVKSDRYDINAKAAEDDPQTNEIRLMLQGLFEDRFGLKYHWETKEVPGYDLVVSKAGKLHLAKPGDCPADGLCGGLNNSPGHTKGYKLTSGDLAGGLSFLLRKPVVDKTNLTGKYDVELEWTVESAEMRAQAPAEQRLPTIFTAIQEQLGLKLVPAKTNVQVFVIDRIGKPSGN